MTANQECFLGPFFVRGVGLLQPQCLFVAEMFAFGGICRAGLVGGVAAKPLGSEKGGSGSSRPSPSFGRVLRRCFRWG